MNDESRDFDRRRYLTEGVEAVIRALQEKREPVRRLAGL